MKFDFRQELSPQSRIVATAEIKTKVAEKLANGTLILEASQNHLDINRVLVDGKEVAFERQGNRLLITPDAVKKSYVITIDYQLRFSKRDPECVYGVGCSSGLTLKDGRFYSLTWPYYANTLFPSNSNPADGATARVQLLGNPRAAGFDMFASGVKDSRGRYVITHEVPSYAIALYGAPQFERVSTTVTLKSGRPLTITVLSRPQENLDPTAQAEIKKRRQEYLQDVAKTVGFLETKVGPFEFGEEFNIVEETDLGGMEHVNAVAVKNTADSMRMETSHRKKVSHTPIHETIHHWFGNNIRIKDWGQFVVSEGFTEYYTLRALRELYGEEIYYDRLSISKGYATRSMPEMAGRSLYAPSTQDPQNYYDTSISYHAGAWLLRRIEVEVGTDVLDRVVSQWFNANRGKAASIQDFIAFLSQETGRDFSGLLNQLNGLKRVPTYKIDVTKEDSTTTVFKIAPAAEGDPDSIVIPLHVEFKDGTKAIYKLKLGETFTLTGFVKKYDWDPQETVFCAIKATKK